MSDSTRIVRMAFCTEAIAMSAVLAAFKLDGVLDCRWVLVVSPVWLTFLAWPTLRVGLALYQWARSKP